MREHAGYYAPRYAGGSKANRLRAFWTQEPNHLVGKLVRDLLEYWRPTAGDHDRGRLFQECERMAGRLEQSAQVDALDAISPEGAERGVEARTTTAWQRTVATRRR